MRIGVVLCTCGGTLEEKIDFVRLEDLAKSLENVAVVKKVDTLCKNPEKHLDFKVDRILFVGCSERSSLTFNEDRIKQVLEEIGIDGAMFEVANVREQCAWIHEDKEEATRKAMDLLLMAYVKLRSNRPTKNVKLEKKVLVIGGGVAGLSCAISLAKMGIPVTLVERKPYLGGHVCQIPLLWQSEGYSSVCTSECILPVIAREAIFSDRVKVLTNSEVKEIEKVDGNFRVKIERKAEFVDSERCVSCGRCAEVCPIEVPNEFDLGYGKRKAIYKAFPLAIPDTYTIDENACNKCGKCLEVCPTNAINLNAKPKVIEDSFGAVVIATGFEERKEREGSSIITLMELERLIAKNFNGNPPSRLVFVLCKKDDAKYCSRLCCPITVKLAMRLAMMYPEMEITVIYKSLRTYGRAFEDFRRTAEMRGVEFVQAELKGIESSNGFVKVVTDKGEFEADLVVIPEPMKSSGIDLMRLFGVQLDEREFPIEFQPRNLNPSETYVERVFVIGTAKGFKDVQESVESGRAVAARIYELLNGRVQKFVSVVDGEKCIRCGLCYAVCPHNAISMEGVAKIDPAFCKGCGLCHGVCPSDAIRLVNLEEEQLIEMARVAFKHAKGPRILAFLCYWCSYAAGDLMGVKGLKLPASFRSIRVRCSASLSPEVILKILLEDLADAVLVAGCPPKNCHHIWGNYMEERRIKALKEFLKELGLKDRVRWEHIGVAMWGKLAKVLKSMHEELAQAK